jgi:endonuclease YncB( thermonuclease family)
MLMKILCRKSCPILFSIAILAPCAMAGEILLQVGDIEIEDGDTLIVSASDDERLKIQLTGIDAPEDRDNPKLAVDLKRTGLERERLLELGQAATQELNSIITSLAPLTLHFDPADRDRYGRIPGVLIDAKGNSVAENMVRNGYAIATGKKEPSNQPHSLTDLQQEAVNAGTGLWGNYPEASRRWAGIPAVTAPTPQ